MIEREGWMVVVVLIAVVWSIKGCNQTPGSVGPRDKPPLSPQTGLAAGCSAGALGPPAGAIAQTAPTQTRPPLCADREGLPV